MCCLSYQQLTTFLNPFWAGANRMKNFPLFFIHRTKHGPVTLWIQRCPLLISLAWLSEQAHTIHNELQSLLLGMGSIGITSIGTASCMFLGLLFFIPVFHSRSHHKVVSEDTPRWFLHLIRCLRWCTDRIKRLSWDYEPHICR